MSLRRVLLSACDETGCTMSELSVLAGQNEPYRLDTPAGHRIGQWLAEQMQRLRVRRPVHLRGLHYVLVAAGDVTKPNGEPYINDERNWNWLDGTAAKAARWLGYVDWSDIRDERNEPPELYVAAPAFTPHAGVGFDVHVELPEDVQPSVWVSSFGARQRYQIYIVGEKSSLGDVLGPVARSFHASLALPTGEPSATMVHAIAENMVEDGRPAVVFYFSDCDPSGWQMPVSFARKLQAFRDLLFPDLDVRVWQAALTPEQVRDYGLPSTPLKDSERRADRWRATFGVEQTEIDALAALRPDLLRQLARDAISPFFDDTLHSRCLFAQQRYRQAAERAFAEQVDAEQIDELRERAREELSEMQEQIDELRDALRESVGEIDLDLPDPEVPQPVFKDEPDHAIYSSRLDWSEATRRMVRRKAYGNGADE